MWIDETLPMATLPNLNERSIDMVKTDAHLSNEAKPESIIAALIARSPVLSLLMNL